MNSSLLLTQDELVELTGYKVPKFQVQWLKERGWRFELNRLGRPRVDREYYRQQMGVQGASPEPPEAQPNWAAMDEEPESRRRRS
jgi:hypothetical protein